MKRNIIIIAIAAVLLALVGTTGAVAGTLITSRQIEDGTIRVADLRPGAVDRLSVALPYGVAQVKVQRGTNPASAWATYSTTIGGPVGDTTGGTFRFTCSEANAPCKVSTAGYATEDGVKVYPRVSIQTQSLNGGPQTYCEYGDGIGSPAPDFGLSGVLSTDAAAATALPLNIGGSDDCGRNGSAGTLNEITVPAGYYDVTSTFQFVG
jgi:hypothetical protein